jgi:hypothetical protein
MSVVRLIHSQVVDVNFFVGQPQPSSL